MFRFGSLFLMVVALGCDSQPGKVAVHPVSGQVNYDGKPAAGVQIFLIPTSAPMVPQVPNNPYGVTGPDGKFTLTTYGNGDGAAEGGYQIILNWPPPTTEGEEATTDRLLGWYDAAHTKFSAQINAGSNVLPTFNLPARTKPAETLEGIPGRN